MAKRYYKCRRHDDFCYENGGLGENPFVLADALDHVGTLDPDGWPEVHVKIECYDDIRDRTLRRGDLVGHSWTSTFCALPELVPRFSDVLEGYGQFLPILGSDGRHLSFFKPVRRECLIDVEYMPRETRERRDKTDPFWYYLDEEKIGGATAFYLPGRRQGCFFDESFVDRMRELSLTGLKFELCIKPTERR